MVCLLQKQSGVKSDRKRNSVRKSPSRVADASISVSSVQAADLLRARRQVLQDSDDDDTGSAAGGGSHQVEPVVSDEPLLTHDAATAGSSGEYSSNQAHP